MSETENGGRNSRTRDLPLVPSIDGPNVTEILCAAKGQQFEYVNVADEDELEFD